MRKVVFILARHIRPHEFPGLRAFFKRTISAQTHLLACLLALFGLGVLLKYSLLKNSSLHFWACLVYGVTSVILFAASALYHFLSDGYAISPALRKWLKDIDHFSIYLFIAGSYTVVLLNTVTAPWNLILLVAVWSIAFVGIIYTHCKTKLPSWAQSRWVYTGIFVFMGWTVIPRLGEIIRHLSRFEAWLLVAGGASYTLGAVVYATKRPQLWVGVFGFHELWHLAVILGFAFHYFLILNFYFI